MFLISLLQSNKTREKQNETKNRITREGDEQSHLNLFPVKQHIRHLTEIQTIIKCYHQSLKDKCRNNNKNQPGIEGFIGKQPQRQKKFQQ